MPICTPTLGMGVGVNVAAELDMERSAPESTMAATMPAETNSARQQQHHHAKTQRRQRLGCVSFFSAAGLSEASSLSTARTGSVGVRRTSRGCEGCGGCRD